MNSSTIQVRFPRREYRFTVSLNTMRRQLMLVDDDPAVREMLGRIETVRALLDEPTEERLARIAGKPAEFHSIPRAATT